MDDEVHVNVSGGVDSIATALVALRGYHINQACPYACRWRSRR
ncbi:hypothetical protein [Paenibacillus etheri]|nr:hypothetical protein [Paenibacillus etheri]